MEGDKYQIVLAFTLKLFSEGLVSIIEGSNKFNVIYSVPMENDLSILPQSSKNIDILILELNYPNQKNIEFITHIKKAFPSIHIMLISYIPSTNLNMKLVDSGIDAYILKTCSSQDVLMALDKIMDNKQFICTDVIKTIISENNESQNNSEINITMREKEILALLVNCRTNSQIASDLKLSENTVKTHRKNILNKFGVKNLVGMIRFACRSHILDFESDGFCKECPCKNQC